MQDILIHLFQFADIKLKESLLLVNKELSKLRFKDFIEDDVSKHILKYKGYLNIELYNKMQDKIKFIQQYKIFDINSTNLCLMERNIHSINLIGLINLKELYLLNTYLHDISLVYLINLQKLDIAYNQLKNIDLTGLVNLQKLDISYNRFININLTGLVNLQKLYIFVNSLTQLNLYL